MEEVKKGSKSKLLWVIVILLMYLVATMNWLSIYISGNIEWYIIVSIVLSVFGVTLFSSELYTLIFKNEK